MEPASSGGFGGARRIQQDLQSEITLISTTEF
jgi:hypothetical protein